MDELNDLILDIDRLTTEGVLGFYNCIEVTELFALNKNSREVINVLTHLVYENVTNPEFEKISYLNGKDDLKVSSLKSWYFGIKKYYITLETILLLIKKLINDRTWLSCEDTLPACHYKINPYKFIPADSYDSNVINKLLKNNFFGGSLLIELENEEKNELHFLLDNPPVLQELSSKVSKLIPFSIASVSDKLGSVLIQIPVNIIRARVRTYPDNENLHCKLVWHPSAKKRDVYITFRRMDRDSNIDSFYSTVLSAEQSEMIFPSQYGSPYEMTIWDPFHKVLLYGVRPSSFIKRIALNMRAINGSPRIIPLKNGGFDKIQLYIPQNSMIGEKDSHVKKWSSIRIYRSEREQLLNEKYFVQYNAKGKYRESERTRALSDIRFLINKYGENGVCLWDPYLNGDDLLETLFYNTCLKSKMRAITSSKYSSKVTADAMCSNAQEDASMDEYISDSFVRLATLPPQTLLGLNIEVRKPCGNKGWNFHDRFLIFPYTENEPMAWSIGTSINSVGREHHILQKVSDAQLIADAFEELWGVIQHPDCLVWSTYD
ncbi:hypothetical protein JJP81_24380, partial [Enterobacter cloacae]|nr:hypothetical protein [Enterobacter cloacae]